MTDISEFSALKNDELFPITIKHPITKKVIKGSDGKDVEFFVRTPNSPTLKSRHRKISALYSQDKSDNDGIASPEAMEAYLLQLNAAYIGGWSENWTYEDKKISYSNDAALRVLESGFGDLVLESLGEWVKNWKGAVLKSKPQPAPTDDGAAASTKSAKARSTASKKS